jgi:predicted esterase
MLKYILLLICSLSITNAAFATEIKLYTNLTADSLAVQQTNQIHNVISAEDSVKLSSYEHKSAKKANRFEEKSDWCNYYLYLPKGFDRNKKYDLVIGMHGYLDTAAHFGLIWKDLRNKNIIFIVPQSPFSLLEGTEAVLKWGPQTKFQDVYDNEVYKKGETAVVGILKDAKQLFNIKQTWMLGFSQGAGFTYLIAFHYPELFDGIAPLSGWFVQTGLTQVDFDKCKHIKVVISHGKNDPIINHKQSEAAVDILTKAGFTVKDIPYSGTHTVNHKAVKYMVTWMHQ